MEEAAVLKQPLSILSNLIFDSSVERDITSLVAAPDGPNTCPRLSRSAASMISFLSGKLFGEIEGTFGRACSSGLP